jgi:hypothetical protein
LARFFWGRFFGGWFSEDLLCCSTLCHGDPAMSVVADDRHPAITVELTCAHRLLLGGLANYVAMTHQWFLEHAPHASIVITDDDDTADDVVFLGAADHLTDLWHHLAMPAWFVVDDVPDDDTLTTTRP